MKKIFTLLVLFSVMLVAQPTVDGNTSDASYTNTYPYSSGRDGYGSTNNIGYIKYYADGTNMYVAIECKLETTGNRIMLFMDFSGYNGRVSGQNLGNFSSGTGVLPGSSNTNVRLGMEVDYVFEFNIGGGAGCYFDANRYGTGGLLNAGTYMGASNLSGTPVTPTSLNTNVFNSSNPGVTFAYDNAGTANKGLEFMVPISSFNGGFSASTTVSFFAIITNNANPTDFSNECIPGDAGAANPGTNPDLTSLTGTGAQPLPVELTSFSASIKNKIVNLVWHTATEINNYGFEIEKRQTSIANSQWNKVGFVNGNGNSNSDNEYSFTDKTTTTGKFVYRLKQIDNDGQYAYSKEVEVDLGKPTTFALNQNYPNPFNPSTSIQYSVVSNQHVSLKVFNVLGKEVAVLVNEKQEPGTYTVDFSLANLSGGAYFYRLQVYPTGGGAGEFVQTKKMILLK